MRTLRTLVILGGADGSVSMYQRAEELGFHTVCVDVRPDAPGAEIAGEHLPVSVREPRRIAAALTGRTDLDLAGVLCPASDVGLPAQSWLAGHWGLPSPLPALAVDASVDKPVFRALCERLRLPGYRSVSGNGPRLAEAAARLRFPVLVKPVDSSGSRGVVACADPAGLPAAFASSLSFSPRGRLVVEEQLAGTQLTIEALLAGGKVVFHAVTERTVTPPPLFVTTAHLLPATLPDRVQAGLVSTLERLCAELGYRTGPITLDAVLGRDGELYLLEMGARMGGNGLAELIESCYGVDLLGATIALATGQDAPVEAKPPLPTLVHMFGADRAGLLTGVDGAADVRAMPEVVELRLFAEPGSAVRRYEQAGHKLGYVVLAAESAARLRAAEAAVLATLRFHVDEHTAEHAGAPGLAVPLP